MSEIYERLSKVMEDVGAIRKGQKNEFDHYNFRGIDDVPFPPRNDDMPF